MKLVINPNNSGCGPGARVRRVVGVKIFSVTCKVGYVKFWGFLLGARVGGVVGVRVLGSRVGWVI